MTEPNTNPTPEGHPSATGSGNDTNVLIVCADLTLPKMVHVALQTLVADNPDRNYKVFPAVSKEKVIESLTKFVFHSVLVEEETMTDRTPAQTLEEMRGMATKNPANASVPIIYVCVATDALKTVGLVKAGWSDVLLKPIDTSLFLQKMSLYNSAIPVLAEPILFSMDCAKEVDISLRFNTKRISEYGMTIECNKPLVRGEVVGISAPFLTEPLSAVVLSCAPGADVAHIADLMFIGITPAETQSIRKLIRHEYAEEKQAA